MLKQLHIQNFALIDDATIAFEKGFTVITGETGAGKSIMLDALGLLLGNRADVGALRIEDKKCVIEGEFYIESYGLESFFESHEMDFEKVTVVRREVAKTGKSRAFVNDSPVVLSVLKKLGEQLIDVHSQNANTLLNSDWFYYDILDGVANSVKERENYNVDYRKYLAAQKVLQEKVNRQEALQQELSFKEFQLGELKQADLKQGEQKELEKELDLLSNAENIRDKVGAVSKVIKYGPGSLLKNLGTVKQLMDSLSNLGEDFAELANRVNSASIEIEDIQYDLESLGGSLTSNPSRLSEVDKRLGLLFTLVKKFVVVDADALIDRQIELEKEVQEVSVGGDDIDKLKIELSQLHKDLVKKANALGKKRNAATVTLTKLVLSDLQNLNMSNSRLEVEVATTELNSRGNNEILFHFNANKGGALLPLSAVASGGEFSRIMLSLKKVLSSKKNLPTILFDEIDTGVSGEVADKMSHIMRNMAEKMQVVAITHLPQIASKGHTHLKVYKSDVNDITQSQVTVVSAEDRVTEIAQMLSGAEVTAAAVSNAKELLK